MCIFLASFFFENEASYNLHNESSNNDSPIPEVSINFKCLIQKSP